MKKLFTQTNVNFLFISTLVATVIFTAIICATDNKQIIQTLLQF